MQRPGRLPSTKDVHGGSGVGKVGEAEPPAPQGPAHVFLKSRAIARGEQRRKWSARLERT